ncbi:hypothetical protein Pint_21492 [Pistacia integerrima]|uniref:Uncharacterized protein n=1 Tax=Pistacia integerrima TaxID=434235 RepID=A0ACC0XDK7_9ROSI|nr:hypothetical protein Pint_21492 [Pistacia integerrima]
MAELAAVGSIASVVSAVLEVGKCLAAPIGQFKYLYNYNTNLKNLETEVMTLKKTRDEVQGKVDAAEINGEEIKQSVKEWQTKVDNTINEAERLIEEKEENRRCFKGLRPNCISSYKHSKKAFKLKWDDIGPLLQQEFDEVSFSSIQQSNYETNFVKIRDDVLKLKNARLKVERKVEEAKNNVEEIEEDVKKWLEDVDSIIVKAQELIENQSSIGTDRKTRYQNSKAASELMVTETLDVKKVQTEIADKLGLEFNNESERASKLYWRLNSGKKILLILDNIWEDLDLKTTGIPSKRDRGGCKLLLTTRNLDVLQKMDSTNNFGMGILKEEEAWNLFQKMAGNLSYRIFTFHHKLYFIDFHNFFLLIL